MEVSCAGPLLATSSFFEMLAWPVAAVAVLLVVVGIVGLIPFARTNRVSVMVRGLITHLDYNLQIRFERPTSGAHLYFNVKRDERSLEGGFVTLCFALVFAIGLTAITIYELTPQSSTFVSSLVHAQDLSTPSKVTLTLHVQAFFEVSDTQDTLGTYGGTLDTYGDTLAPQGAPNARLPGNSSCSVRVSIASSCNINQVHTVDDCSALVSITTYSTESCNYTITLSSNTSLYLAGGQSLGVSSSVSTLNGPVPSHALPLSVAAAFAPASLCVDGNTLLDSSGTLASISIGAYAQYMAWPASAYAMPSYFALVFPYLSVVNAPRSAWRTLSITLVPSPSAFWVSEVGRGSPYWIPFKAMVLLASLLALRSLVRTLLRAVLRWHQRQLAPRRHAGPLWLFAIVVASLVAPLVTQYALHFIVGSPVLGIFVSYLVLALQLLAAAALLCYAYITSTASLWLLLPAIAAALLALQIVAVATAWFNHKRHRYEMIQDPR
jgi:hypothetical protein